jgi:lipid II:glycine glycyltransferase (peptidoglycan interpeptide bridge formation enzyme)
MAWTLAKDGQIIKKIIKLNCIWVLIITAIIRYLSREEWQKRAPDFFDYNYHQLWDFGIACARRIGAASEHIAVEQDGQILGLSDVRIKKIPLARTGVAYINGGPLVRKSDGSEDDLLRAVLKKLVMEYVQNRGMVLRIRIPVGTPEWMTRQNKIFTSAGFSVSRNIKPYRTILLDITQSLEQLRKNLEQKWRNNLKRAEKVDLPFQRESSMEFFNRFLSLYRPFIQRKGFDVDLSPDFYMEVQNALEIQERFQVALCEYNGNWIAGHISSLLGDTAVNIFRANDEVALTHRASYMLQWQGICYAKEYGCQRYDLGGIDPDNNPGVYSFKKGMGGEEVTIPGPFEFYPTSFKRVVVCLGEKLYRVFRKNR